MNRVLTTTLLGAALLLAPLASAFAQDRIYRCGNNEYTNNANDAKTRNCKLVENGNVTVVNGSSGLPAPSSSAPIRSPGANANANPGNTRIDSGVQRDRDDSARGILEAELRKAEAKRAELSREYNNGEPEKQGIESRNYQRYLDRVKEMKEALARVDYDIEGLKREISRLPPAR